MDVHFFFSSEAFYLYVVHCWKRIQGFSLLCVFVLLLHGPWCQPRLSVQWNQTDGMGAGYSAILLDLWVAHQIGGWSLHTYLACLWGSQHFSQPCYHRWFQILQCNHASSSLLESWLWLWSTWYWPLFSVLLILLRALARTYTCTIMVARKDGWKRMCLFLGLD